MIIVGITGGIASGKTTVSNFLKKKGVPIHDSDHIVNKIYSNSKPTLLSFLRSVSLSGSIVNKKINKKIIRDEIFNNQVKKKKLEKYIHNEVRKSREIFIKKNIKKKTKLVMLDIPLLFEKKLLHICDYVILLYSPQKIRIQRATSRNEIDKDMVLKIIKNQMKDSLKKKKANFIINTSLPKKETFKMILSVINSIKKKNA